MGSINTKSYIKTDGESKNPILKNESFSSLDDIELQITINETIQKLEKHEYKNIKKQKKTDNELNELITIFIDYH
jgi:hypothetical protein